MAWLKVKFKKTQSLNIELVHLITQILKSKGIITVIIVTF